MGKEVCNAMHVHLEWETGLQRQSGFWHFLSGEGLSLQTEHHFRICWFKEKWK